MQCVPFVWANCLINHEGEREALVLFQASNPRHEKGRKKTMERDLNKAIGGASSAFLECLSSVHAFIACNESTALEPIARKIIEAVERSRCVDTYITLLWFTFDGSIFSHS